MSRLGCRDAGPAYGQIDLYIGLPADLLPQARAGTIRRCDRGQGSHDGAPDIPTANEAGIAGFSVSAWFGYWAPKGTPPDLIAKLDAATIEALADPAGGSASA